MFLKYLASTDHKVIGLLYAFTSLFFLLVGFILVIIIRWQLAYPGEPLPIIGSLLGAANTPGGIVLPEFYNQLGAMHGTIMVFLGVVPLAVGAFGNYIVPLQIGAPRHGVPPSQPRELLVLIRGRHGDARQLFRARRRGQQRVDLLCAGLQGGERQQQQERGDELRSDEEGQPEPRQSGRAKLNDGRDEIQGTEQRRENDEQHAAEPHRLAVARRQVGQRCSGRPIRWASIAPIRPHRTTSRRSINSISR